MVHTPRNADGSQAGAPNFFIHTPLGANDAERRQAEASAPGTYADVQQQMVGATPQLQPTTNPFGIGTIRLPAQRVHDKAVFADTTTTAAGPQPDASPLGAQTADSVKQSATAPSTGGGSIPVEVPEQWSTTNQSATSEELWEKVVKMRKVFEKSVKSLNSQLESVVNENKSLKAKLDEGTGHGQPGQQEATTGRLKQMDYKRIEKPGKYNGDPTEFLTWYELFYNYLVSCDSTWKIILDGLRKYQNAPIRNNEEVRDALVTAQHPSLASQYEEYARQLYMYMLSHTRDDTNSKVLKATAAEAFDTYRDIVYKGFNMHSEKLITLEGAMYQPRRAKNEKDFDKAHTE